MDRIALSRPNITDEEIAAAERVLRSRWLVYGDENRAFEEELAAYCGRKYALAVSSGTAALHLSLLARGQSPEAVLVPAFTYPATANVVRFLPSLPAVHLADVDPETFCLPAATISAWLKRSDEEGGEDGDPCVVVHQFGYPSPLPQGAAAASSLILSDAACAVGVPGAMRGHSVCLSFHPRKLLTTGEGGAVLSDDADFIDKVRRLRAHGLSAVPGREVMALEESGLNYRLNEVGAAIGRVQLRRLPSLIERHRELGQRYRSRLGSSGIPLQADHRERIYQTLAVVLPAGCGRARLRQELLADGIETQIASYGLHQLEAFADAEIFCPDGSRGSSADLAVSEQLAEQGLALPLHSELSLADVDRVCETLLKRVGKKKRGA